MGNNKSLNKTSNQEYISLNKTNLNYQESSLCELQGEGNIVSLKFEDGNYEQQIKNSKLLQFLDKYSENRIKLIVTIGDRGVGKSLIQNFIIQKYQNRSEYFQIFKSKFNEGNCTQGIKFYFPQNLKEPKDQKEDILLFFDCEGFDLTNKTSLHQQNMIKLICLISRLSACLIYVQTTLRDQDGFKEIIKTLNENRSTNDCPHENFISILNKWNGLQFQPSSKFLKKQFKLKSLNLNEKNEIIVDQNYDQFIQEINAIKNYCVQSKYTSSQSSCKAFEREQTQKQMNFTSQEHFQLINKQLELKQDHAKNMNAIREFMKQNYESQIKTLQKNEGSKLYSNLDSVKPQEIREYERQINNYKVNEGNEIAKNMLAASLIFYASQVSIILGGEILRAEGIIMMIGFRTLFFSLGFAFAILPTILQALHYLVKKNKKNSLSKNIEKALFSSINQNKFVLSSSKNNLSEIKEILLSQIPKFNDYIQFINSQQEKEAICLLLLMNCISKPFDQQSLEKQKTDSYKIDNYLFQCAVLLAKQLKLNNYSNFENLSLTHKIDELQTFQLLQAIISESQLVRG
ncbi:transmembrane protein, putative (macronuclear) [Tetrahymena thermophila SB210]|uniref:Transmembrane protein, putative n=1 Tax=Tetrahymena thermophila (strain SB210) TaxID=312017 RepID=Q22KW2_TETTS|nr:transmembrane protein, putative [Tetrahymena thermophila SB210]EAR85916.3 transmembrane protein, putative [Tetrahymena thermophila SB210]|eukprot:XP_976511.3 transmembrane protein, putative [Tetrahymena thermophila SB210]